MALFTRGVGGQISYFNSVLLPEYGGNPMRFITTATY